MFLRVRDSHSRSILNAVSWRVTGSIDSFVLGFIFTGATSWRAQSPVLKRSRKWSSTIFTKELGPSFARTSSSSANIRVWSLNRPASSSWPIQVIRRLDQSATPLWSALEARCGPAESLRVGAGFHPTARFA